MKDGISSLFRESSKMKYDYHHVLSGADLLLHSPETMDIFSNLQREIICRRSKIFKKDSISIDKIEQLRS